MAKKTKIEAKLTTFEDEFTEDELQKVQECLEGSETNADRPDRMMKRHERATSFLDDDIV